MTGTFSRNKGTRGELELIHLLHDNLGGEYSRNLKQYQQAQNGDVEQLVGPYLIEVKNCVQITLRPWWSQIRTAAAIKDAVPCLAYKIARRGWRFVVPTNEARCAGQEWSYDLCYTQELYLEGFFLHIREMG